MKKANKDFLFLLFGGFTAGLAGGLLGAGGGIIIIFSLARILRDQEMSPRDIFANALCVMLPLSATSTAIYALRGSLSLEGFSFFLLPAILGGIFGGLLLDKINTTILRTIFAGIMVFSGFSLIFR